MTNILKIIAITIISLLSLNGSAQSIDSFIEETAFNYYKTNILPKSSIKKKLKISENLSVIYYLDASCLKDKIENEKIIVSVPSLKYRQGYRFNLKNDKKQFKKVKHINKNSNTEMFVEVSTAYVFNNRFFVVINEFIKVYGKTYTFEFDKYGNIIDWCLSSESIRVIAY